LEYLFLNTHISIKDIDDCLLRVLNRFKYKQFREKITYSAIFTYPEQIRLRPSLYKIYEKQIRKLASGEDLPVTFIGETGVGKTTLARILHQISPRHEGTFIDRNLSAMAETLQESELFGHEKGAFTGAGKMKKGIFELADKGTVFIDEIGDVPLSVQSKILKAVDQKKFYRVGGEKEIESNFRLICATHQDLKQLKKKGEFREDLYYRIYIPIHLPPIRDNKDDIIELGRYFFDKYKNDTKAIEYNEEIEKELLSHTWHGNVRELENSIQYAITMSDGPDIVEVLGKCIEEVSLEDINKEDPPFKDLNNEKKRQRILTAIKKCNGNKTKAAELLGICRKSLYDNMKKLIPGYPESLSELSSQ
jgi:DNA-binding NtrC family response regulator